VSEDGGGYRIGLRGARPALGSRGHRFVPPSVPNNLAERDGDVRGKRLRFLDIALAGIRKDGIFGIVSKDPVCLTNVLQHCNNTSDGCGLASEQRYKHLAFPFI
jgi:hypothetical protein